MPAALDDDDSLARQRTGSPLSTR